MAELTTLDPVLPTPRRRRAGCTATVTSALRVLSRNGISIMATPRMGPPADKLWPVEPIGVLMMTPSPPNWETASPSTTRGP